MNILRRGSVDSQNFLYLLPAEAKGRNFSKYTIFIDVHKLNDLMDVLKILNMHIKNS